MIPAFRPRLIWMLTLSLALLGGARVAASCNDGNPARAGNARALADASPRVLASTAMPEGVADNRLDAQPAGVRWLRRVSWLRASGRRLGRELLTGGGLALQAGSMLDPYALSEIEDGRVGDERPDRAGVAVRTAGPPRAPPSLS
jgi:hypothetical protein